MMKSSLLSMNNHPIHENIHYPFERTFTGRLQHNIYCTDQFLKFKAISKVKQIRNIPLKLNTKQIL